MDNPFNTSSHLPFTIKEGDSVEIARYNRIAAINRINHLVQQKIPDFDVYKKSQTYTQVLDLEVWKRFYKDSPSEKISEEFCQRMATVCIEMEDEKLSEKVVKEEFEEAIHQHTQQVMPHSSDKIEIDRKQFIESINKIKELTKPIEKKDNFIKRFVDGLIKFLDKCHI